MKKIHSIFAILSLCVLITVSGCQNDDVNSTKNPVSQASERETMLLGEALAKSLKDKDVRDFLKKESLKQFDKDYDILFQMVKEKEVRPGESFIEILSKNASLDTDLNEITKKLPLLTIFVPNLPNFSASNWDTENDITPIVAMAIDVQDDVKTIKLIDSENKISAVNLNQAPTFPVIVLKNNERVAVTSKTKGNSNLRKEIIFENEEFSYNSLEDNNRAESNARALKFENFNIKVQEAYTKSLNCSNCYHRDYIYYNISPSEGVFQGPFNNNYSEAITALNINNLSGLSAITSNWTEGALEFHFNIVFIGSNAQLDKLEKTIFVNPDDLISADKSLPALYNLPVPVVIVPWKMSVYGDRWKFAVNEFDPGAVVTQEVTTTSTHSTNFTVNVNTGEADGVKTSVGYGETNTKTTTGKAVVATTLASNNLGEAVLNWFDPVIYAKTKVPFKNMFIGTTKSIDTGAISFSLEPVKTF